MQPTTLKESNELQSAFVVKSNELIQKTTFSLTAQQQKIVLFIASKIKPEDEMFHEYCFTIPEFCQICGIEKGGKQYDELWNALEGLRKADIKYNGSTRIPIDNDTETTLQWVLKCFFDKKAGLVHILMDPSMVPFLLRLKSNFTQYELIWTLQFKSKYAIRLYEYCKSRQYNKLKEYSFRVTLDELQDRMGSSYPRFPNFRQKALDVAVREINEKSDMMVEYSAAKTGKAVSALDITVKTKEVGERLKRYAEIEKTYMGRNL